MGDDAFFGIGCKCFPWTMKAGRLHALPITIGRDVNFGTEAIVLGGANVADNGAAAAFSCVRGDVPSGKLMLGSRVVRQFAAPAGEGTFASFTSASRVATLGSCLLLFAIFEIPCQFGAMYQTILYDSENSPVPEDWVLDSDFNLLTLLFGFTKGVSHKFLLHGYLGVPAALWAAGAVGFGLCLLIPIYCCLVALIAHWLLVPQGFNPTVLKPWTFDWMRYMICFKTYFMMNPIAIRLVRGTEFELLLYRLIGLSTGTGAHFDGALVFEPYLITMGDDCTLNGYCQALGHDIQPVGISLRHLEIGDRFTMMRGGCLHGGDEAAADVTMLPVSCPMIGTKLAPGAWSGYPCERVDASNALPPPPPTPPPAAGLRFLRSLPSVLPAMLIMTPLWLWDMILRTLRACGLCRRARKPAAPGQNTGQAPPAACAGTFVHEPTQTVVSLEAGRWMTAREVEVDAHCVLSPPQAMRWALAHCSFRLNFNPDHSRAEARLLRRGGVLIPPAWLTASLARADGARGWVVEWRWLGGAVQTCTLVPGVAGPPRSAAQIMAGWVGRALAGSGKVNKANDVVGVAVRRVEVNGYASETVRVLITLKPRARGPASVIVKLPSQDATTRATSDENQLTETEVRFYRELVPALQAASVSLAECLHLEALGGQDHVMVFEDLGLREGYHAGDQSVGVSDDELKAGCLALARLHAAYWGQEDRMPAWVRMTNQIDEMNVEATVRSNWAAWRASAWPSKGGVGPEALATVEFIVDNIGQLSAMLDEAPRTLVHHDARPDNIFFGPAKGAAPGAVTDAVLLDWQSVGRGKGPIDLAKYLIANFEPSPGRGQAAARAGGGIPRGAARSRAAARRRALGGGLYLPCTFPVPSLYLPCTIPVQACTRRRPAGATTASVRAGASTLRLLSPSSTSRTMQTFVACSCSRFLGGT